MCVCAEFVLADISVGPRRTITDCETEIRGIADFPILFCAACVQQPLPPDTCACVYYVYVCVCVSACVRRGIQGGGAEKRSGEKRERDGARTRLELCR